MARDAEDIIPYKARLNFVGDGALAVPLFYFLNSRHKKLNKILIQALFFDKICDTMIREEKNAEDRYDQGSFIRYGRYHF